MEDVNQRQGGDRSGSLGNRIAENAVPIALAGVGVAWLVSNIRGRGRDETAGTPLRLVKKGQKLANGTWHGAQRATTAVGRGAKATAGGVATGAHKVQGGFASAVRENPLAVGAAALAVGAVVGLVLPVTERENELFGEARDTLLENARAFASEVVDETLQSARNVSERVVNEAGRAIEEEGRKQGIVG